MSTLVGAVWDTTLNPVRQQVNGYRELNGVKLHETGVGRSERGMRVTLQELIQTRMRELGLSYRKLGQRAVEAGAPTPPNFHHLATREITEFPKVRTVPAIADALDVPLDVVVDAILESLGLVTARVDAPSRRTAPSGQTGEPWKALFPEGMSAADVADMLRNMSETVADLAKHRKSDT